MSEYYQPCRTEFSQGDIVELAPHSRITDPLLRVNQASEGTFALDKSGPLAVGDLRVNRGMLMTYDCEIDKSRFWHLWPIHELALLNGTDQGNVRKNKKFSFLHLPAYGTMPDAFLDFSTVTTVAREVLESCSRLFTLSDLGRQALYHQHIRWFTRWAIQSVKCPQCGTSFNPADVLPVRPAD